MEHYEPGRTPNIGREGIYLPPSTLKEKQCSAFCRFRADPGEPAGAADPARAQQHPERRQGGVEVSPF